MDPSCVSKWSALVILLALLTGSMFLEFRHGSGHGRQAYIHGKHMAQKCREDPIMMIEMPEKCSHYMAMDEDEITRSGLSFMIKAVNPFAGMDLVDFLSKVGYFGVTFMLSSVVVLLIGIYLFYMVMKLQPPRHMLRNDERSYPLLSAPYVSS